MISIKAYIFGNTGSIEDDIEWYFSLPFFPTKGMKIKNHEDVTYIVLDSYYNLGIDIAECVLQISN